MFPDAPSIAPYLEHPQTGPTGAFCAALARRLGCFVVVGLPERLSNVHASPSASAHANVNVNASAQLVGANAALLFDSTGHLTHTYHKSNLFPTDRSWARPGPGFTALDLPWPFGRTAFAICNDLNVTVNVNVNVNGSKDAGGWRSIEAGPYELAGFCVRENVRVLVVLNAWLRPEDGGMEGVGEGAGGGGGGEVSGSHPDTDGDEVQGGEEGEEGDGLEPNWQVLNYWAMRLRPLWAKDSVHADTVGAQDDARQESKDEQDLVVVVCNRCGRERGVLSCSPLLESRVNCILLPGKVFAGSSAMFSMRRGAGKPRLLHFMGEREEGVSVWTVRLGSPTLPVA